MRAFSQHTGRVAPLNRANIDTDQIIPKQFLKRIERTGYGEFLFYDWRRTASGTPQPDFVLNQPRFQGATILAANRNFGCGSSREHAVWALSDYGFRVIIAPSFADIFTNNCSKNGLLAIALAENEVDVIMGRAEKAQNYQVSVNLEEMTVTDEQGLHATFTMDPGRRDRYLHGLDDIAITLQSLDLIDGFEAHRKDWLQFEHTAADRLKD